MAESTSPSTSQASAARLSSSPEQSQLQPDQSDYTWSNFFSIMTGFADSETRKRYIKTKDTLNEKEDCERCDKHKAWLFKHSPIIQFLQHNIDLLGPATGKARITEENVRCKRCDTHQAGAFDTEYGIMLCANELRSRGHLEDTLAHEMVHAYDHMRYKLDPYDLRHAACMEIRAATLSGECRWTREFWTRNQWKLTQQLQECVRRRAALSVAARPACEGDDVKAVRVVNEVWDACFYDTRPFDFIYR